MAISAAAMQAALGTNPNNAWVLQHAEPLVGSVQRWYLVGNLDARGKAKWVETTAASDAATQAAQALTLLNAS